MQTGAVKPDASAEPGRSLSPLPQYTCGLCSETWGTNCTPGDISCPECEANLCPCCGIWFDRDGNVSQPARRVVTRDQLAAALARCEVPARFYGRDGASDAVALADAIMEALGDVSYLAEATDG